MSKGGRVRRFTYWAIDGRDVHEPGELRDTAVNLPAGGRVDIGLTAPGRIEIGGSVAVTVGSAAPAPSRRPNATLDPLSYGTPQALPFAPEKANRRFTYDINRRPGFIDGRPGLFWTVNGQLFPDIPMFLVSEGDIVRMTIVNHSSKSRYAFR